jgi:protein-S-isoprenylcysteine O-methyltransferase Ste14
LKFTGVLKMRWIIFILLLIGSVFCLSVFAPATQGNGGLLWPFSADTKPIFALVGGLPGQFTNIITPLLAGVSILGFLVALIGLFWSAIPTKGWTTLVAVAVTTSFVLYLSYFGTKMIVPILVDVVIVWGILTRRWQAEVTRMRSIQNPPIHINPLMHIPVPWVFVLAYLLGFGLQLLFPTQITSAGILLISRVIGGVLLATGGILAAWSLLIFHRSSTTTVPLETSSNLVTWGPYRFSRNPMYIGLTLIYLGEAGLLIQIWPIFTLLLTFIYINWTVIPFEEDRLKKVFGDVYISYCKRVRRWI